MPRLRATSLAKANLDLWLNNILLKDGFYSTITTGETDVYGRDISLLSLKTDEDYADGTVYQSIFKSWVHESGIVPTHSISSPTLPSGVTVNGTFYPQSSGAAGYSSSFSHKFDFINGRVIFDSPIATNSNVQCEFSYKEVPVHFADEFEDEEREFLVDSYRDNPFQTGVVVYPDKNQLTLPIIQIDFHNREMVPYELGAPSNVAEFRGSFIIWSRDSATKDMIADLIMQHERSVLIGIDFNTAPMPLTRDGDKNEDFTSYESLAVVGGPHMFKRIYIDELKEYKTAPYYNVERGRIDFLVRIYPNF